MRFTAPLHHVNVDLLRSSYDNLKTGRIPDLENAQQSHFEESVGEQAEPTAKPNAGK
jgi:hypothetical protein